MLLIIVACFLSLVSAIPTQRQLNNNDNLSLQLVEAARTGQLDAVKDLLKKPGINVNKADQFGATALMWASREGYTDIVKELLKKPGINVHKCNPKSGHTALIYATNFRRSEIVDLLKEYESWQY
jgi:ankyrin repeat protein